MGRLVAKIGKFEIRKTQEFNFVITHPVHGKVQAFRTESRCRDLIEMLIEAGRADA